MSVGKVRLLVIGLDAATFPVIDPLLERGRLPNLKQLIETGSTGILKSTIPPLSPAAWVSAMTGRNPGKHGVFDFRRLYPHDLKGRLQELASSQEYAGTTIFDVLGQSGRRVGAFNIPLTYPAWKVNGIMVSGPITPDHRRAYTCPPGLSESVGEMARHINPDHLLSFSERAFLEELIWDTQRHFQLAGQLLDEQGPFDLFWFHLHALDSAQHRFWRYTDPEWFESISGNSDGLAEAINNLYSLADEGLGRLLPFTGSESVVLVVSDHGAGPKGKTEVRFNAWLRQEGLLSFASQTGGKFSRRIYPSGLKQIVPGRLRTALKNHLPANLRSRAEENSSFQVDWQATRAFFFPLTAPIGGININLVGRQPQGSVSSADYQSVRESVYVRLFELRDPTSDRPILKEIYFKEELYTGPFIDLAPDIIFQIDSKYYPSSATADPWIGPTDDTTWNSWSGVHTPDGIFIAHGPEVLPGKGLEGANIIDLAPTILYALGCPIPADMDGKILEEIFSQDFRDRNPAVSGPSLGTPEINIKLSAADYPAMIERLRFLGYIE